MPGMSTLRGVLYCVVAVLFASRAIAADPPTDTKPTFDKTGPQVGDQLPDLKLRTLKDEPVRLGDAWRNGPALIVTSSFTCPKSRSRWPELNDLATKYSEKKLNVVIVYVIEAHPTGSVCPYKGVEEVTVENQRDGILRKQPATLEDRLDLAKEFKQYLRIDVPIYVDTMKNEAWKAFGAAPNKAFVVDSKGIVVARQGWFDGKALDAEVEPLMKRLSEKKPSSKDGIDDWKEFDARLAAVGLDYQAIRRLIDKEDVAALKAAIKKVPEIATHIHDSMGRGDDSTFLSYSVERGKLKSVDVLLDAGGSLAPDTMRLDPMLVLAARNGNAAMVDLLLKRHADPNLPATGRTPLHESLLQRHDEVARMLIKAGAKEDLFSWSAIGAVDKVGKLLDDDPSLALRPDGYGRCALDYAAANGKVEMSRLLIDRGSPVFTGDEGTALELPIHYAIRSGAKDVLELLLVAGHSPNIGKWFYGGGVPLELAIRKHDSDLVKVLLAHKANVEIRNAFSLTPLHIAAEVGDADAVELLLKAGAYVDVEQKGFYTPCGPYGDNVPRKTTPLHLASESGTPAAMKLLIKAGAKLDAPTRDGRTPLIVAAAGRERYYFPEAEHQVERIKLLLDAGAKINAEDLGGQTALDLIDVEINEPVKADEDEAYRAVKNARVERYRKVRELLVREGAKPGSHDAIDRGQGR